MKKHTKVYFKACGYDPDQRNQYVPSELSTAPGVDIHHIISRSKGGEDRIENLMALTRKEHEAFGDRPQHMVFLFDMHEQFLLTNGIPYDYEYLNSLKKKYVAINKGPVGQ